MSAESILPIDLGFDIKEAQPRSRGVVGVYLGGGKLKTGEFKALVKFQGLPTAARAINALFESPEVNRVIAAIPNPELVAPYTINVRSKEITYTEPGDKFAGTIRSAIELVLKGEDVVVLFSDIPFVKSKTISLLVGSVSNEELIVPAVSKATVDTIDSLHNLHFMPCKDGYFHLGNALYISNTAIEKLKMDDLQEMYEGKSFRTNPKKKLEVARKMIGYDGLATAIRIWISANLQHKNAAKLDSIIPSPSLRDYERMLSKLLRIDSKILVGRFADLFLDYDYPDDTEQMQSDFESIRTAFEQI